MPHARIYGRLLEVCVPVRFTGGGLRRIVQYRNQSDRRIIKDVSSSFVLYVGKKKLVKRREFELFLSRTLEI